MADIKYTFYQDNKEAYWLTKCEVLNFNPETDRIDGKFTVTLPGMVISEGESFSYNIHNCAFYGDEYIDVLEVPGQVYEVGQYAFKKSNIKQIYFKNEFPPVVYQETFADMNQITQKHETVIINCCKDLGASYEAVFTALPQYAKDENSEGIVIVETDDLLATGTTYAALFQAGEELQSIQFSSQLEFLGQMPVLGGVATGSGKYTDKSVTLFYDDSSLSVNGVANNGVYQLTTRGIDQIEDPYNVIDTNVESHIISFHKQKAPGLLGLMPGSEMYFINDSSRIVPITDKEIVYVDAVGLYAGSSQSINDVPIEEYNVGDIVFINYENCNQCYRKQINSNTEISEWELYQDNTILLEVPHSRLGYSYLLKYSEQEQKWIYVTDYWNKSSFLIWRKQTKEAFVKIGGAINSGKLSYRFEKVSNQSWYIVITEQINENAFYNQYVPKNKAYPNLYVDTTIIKPLGFQNSKIDQLFLSFAKNPEIAKNAFIKSDIASIHARNFDGYMGPWGIDELYNILYYQEPLNNQQCNYYCYCSPRTELVPDFFTEYFKNDGVYIINDYAFYNTSIQRITISANCKHINRCGFANCQQLYEVDVTAFANSETNPKIDGKVIEPADIFDPDSFSGCTNLVILRGKDAWIRYCAESRFGSLSSITDTAILVQYDEYVQQLEQQFITAGLFIPANSTITVSTIEALQEACQTSAISKIIMNNFQTSGLSLINITLNHNVTIMLDVKLPKNKTYQFNLENNAVLTLEVPANYSDYILNNFIITGSGMVTFKDNIIIAPENGAAIKTVGGDITITVLQSLHCFGGNNAPGIHVINGNLSIVGNASTSTLLCYGNMGAEYFEPAIADYIYDENPTAKTLQERISNTTYSYASVPERKTDSADPGSGILFRSSQDNAMLKIKDFASVQLEGMNTGSGIDSVGIVSVEQVKTLLCRGGYTLGVSYNASGQRIVENIWPYILAPEKKKIITADIYQATSAWEPQYQNGTNGTTQFFYGNLLYTPQRCALDGNYQDTMFLTKLEPNGGAAIQGSKIQLKNITSCTVIGGHQHPALEGSELIQIQDTDVVAYGGAGCAAIGSTKQISSAKQLTIQIESTTQKTKKVSAYGGCFGAGIGSSFANLQPLLIQIGKRIHLKYVCGGIGAAGIGTGYLSTDNLQIDINNVTTAALLPGVFYTDGRYAYKRYPRSCAQAIGFGQFFLPAPDETIVTPFVSIDRSYLTSTIGYFPYESMFGPGMIQFNEERSYYTNRIHIDTFAYAPPICCQVPTLLDIGSFELQERTLEEANTSKYWNPVLHPDDEQKPVFAVFSKTTSSDNNINALWKLYGKHIMIEPADEINNYALKMYGAVRGICLCKKSSSGYSALIDFNDVFAELGVIKDYALSDSNNPINFDPNGIPLQYYKDYSNTSGKLWLDIGNGKYSLQYPAIALMAGLGADAYFSSGHLDACSNDSILFTTRDDNVQLLKFKFVEWVD